jgi:L-alanine-DL-glutamate epimerase-like enolase superfamily enzyme
VPRTAEAGRAGPLAAALAELRIAIERIEVVCGTATLPSYPGGARPTSTVVLAGHGVAGRGENVAWTADAHAHLDVAAVPRGTGRLGEWAAAIARGIREPYAHAALEAAAIDLALRQARTNVCELADVAPDPVRYVVSFEKVTDPVARARAEPGPVALKVDADPSWDDATWAALASTGRVAILDFKGAGRAPDLERAHRALPCALLEDPGDAAWSASFRRRLALDAAIVSAAALDNVVVRPVAVNLKPARMGGVLEALRCAARCAELGVAIYMGGMFEVTVGRRQLRALAAALCPDATNDIAPLDCAERPPRLAIEDGPGFA